MTLKILRVFSLQVVTSLKMLSDDSPDFNCSKYYLNNLMYCFFFIFHISYFSFLGGHFEWAFGWAFWTGIWVGILGGHLSEHSGGYFGWAFE